MPDTAEDKIGKATSLICLRDPFFASFLVKRNVIESTDPKCKTMRTDGRTIEWCRSFVDECSVLQVAGVLVHEVCHIFLKHHLRRFWRKPRKWNTATDYVIDPMVIQRNYKLPNGPGLEQHHDQTFRNWVAEKVYDKLPDEPEDQYGNGVGECMDGSNADGSAMSEDQIRSEEAMLDQEITVAAQSVKDIGKLPGAIQEVIRQARESQVPFEDILERFIGGEQPDGHNFSKPNRHQFHMMRLMMPSINRVGVGNIVIAIDTSGSMSKPELASGFSEVKHLMEQFKPDSVTIIYADSKIQKVEEFGPGEEIDRLEIVGRGGTRVRPAINYATHQIERVDRFIYITDMEFSDAGEPPDFPVLWLGTASKQRPPYGQFAAIPPGGRR